MEQNIWNKCSSSKGIMLFMICFSDSGFDSDIDSLLNGNSISSSSDVYQKLKVGDNMNFVYQYS